MGSYKIVFIGRESGAIGITYKITKTVEATTKELAVLKLYDKHEHISVLNIEKLEAGDE